VTAEVTPAPFLEESILAPIAGANPAGQDLSYDPAFEQLAAEIEKVTSVAGELPDWGLVRRESARILREGSKDLRAASWWVASAGILEGWPAVAEGATTYQALVERFWNEMYPPIKRLRARAGLVTWLWEQLAKSLAAKNVTIADGDAVRAFDAAITAIDGAFGERVGDANPGLGALRGVVRDKVRSIPEPPKAADPFAAPAAPAPPSGGGQPSPSPASTSSSSSSSSAAISAISAPSVGAVASLDAAETAADGWKGPLATLAYHARAAAPTAPWPYRLARIAAWLTLETAPVAEGGKTFVRGPKNADRTDFQGMFDAGSWEGLRNASEEALAEHALWLDLNRWSAIALERLGPPFAAAREAVGRETAALVARIPGLPSLFFSNGTPFASPETVDWIAAEQARFGGGGGRAASPADEAPKALLADAEARVAAGQVDEGLALAIALGNNAASAAVRFRAQLLAAQMAQRAAKGALAIALLERLLPQIDATLEAWEPDVCASFFETALKVYRAEFPDAVERQSLLFRRLLQVDPAAALRIG
jgi:type VI secretion system protein VasJ